MYAHARPPRRQRENGDDAQTGGLSPRVREMYRYLAIANYEDRFVIPTTHRHAGTPSDCAGLRLHVRQRLLRRRFGTQPVRRQPQEGHGDGRQSLRREEHDAEDTEALRRPAGYRAGPHRRAARDHGVVVGEGDLPETRDALRGWLKRLETTDLLDLEGTTLATFDRGRATSLHPVRARARRFLGTAARPWWIWATSPANAGHHLSRPASCRLPAGAARIPCPGDRRRDARCWPTASTSLRSLGRRWRSAAAAMRYHRSHPGGGGAAAAQARADRDARGSRIRPRSMGRGRKRRPSDRVAVPPRRDDRHGRHPPESRDFLHLRECAPPSRDDHGPSVDTSIRSFSVSTRTSTGRLHGGNL